ncbi:mitochondrial carrier domain-containing protein [Pilobolus umbonatus]|nr:mitochondrial carrier domain-containing protein [Pilobolus umbonatus]
MEISSFEDYKLPPLGHAISGAIGSTIASLFIYPLDIATTRLQLKEGSERKKTLRGTIEDIYHKEGGLKALYVGLEADTVATVLSSFIYFYCYTALRNVQEKLNSRLGKSTAELDIVQELFLGAEAALISRLFTTPVSNMTTHFQTNGINNKKSVKEIALEIMKEQGITGFWAGYRASIVLVSNPSITYFVFEKIKSFYTRLGKRQLTSAQVFLFSACAKSLATMITYPFIFLRTQMVSQKESQQGMMDTFRAVVERDGYRGLYKGMRAQIIKGFFNQGIMYMIKDYVATYLALMFYHSYKIRMKAKLA